MSIHTQNRKQFKRFLCIPLISLFFSGTLSAEPDKLSDPNDFPLPAAAEVVKRKVVVPSQDLWSWDKKRHSAMKADKLKKDKKLKETAAKESILRKQIIKIPPPYKNTSSLDVNFNSFFHSVGELLLPSVAQAATFNQYGDIVIDGNLSEWTQDDRINLPLDRPPYLASGDELYGKYIDQANPVYVIALKSTAVAIGSNTTFWLNTDQNANTGFKIWGAYGGAEHFINIYSNSEPHLYNSEFAWLSGPLNYAYNLDKSVIEIAIPVSLLTPLASNQSINVLGDINDTVFLFPQDYVEGGQYTIAGMPQVLPPRTDFSKRVGIIFSETSSNHFFDKKAYSQLFMSLQHQAMMAGISFDLLNENELTDIGNLVNYDALIFPYFANVPNSIRKQVRQTLYTAIYKYGIGIITADNWMTNDETGAAFSGDSYQIMKQLLGLGRLDGLGPVDIDLVASDVTVPAMKGYTLNEKLITYKNSWVSYFEPVQGQPVSYLAKQTISLNGIPQATHPGIIASKTGGRHVHFATSGFMGDGPLVWQALQWVVYNNDTPVGLKIGRNNNVFISRNDMDLAQSHDEVPSVHVPLFSLLQDWKNKYNFVGSYYIDIGNNPAEGEWTEWNVSAPLYKNYVALQNEIGTHSWTHPNVTDILTPAEIEFEFNQSMNEISANVGATWQNQDIRGGAVPGAPESFTTAAEILQHLDYLSGGWSSVGAGYPNAFGYFSPDNNKVYFSPNMSFDFTLIEFGVPVGSPPVPVPLNAVEAEQYWKNEYDRLIQHASLPIVHWPWHDYGPTISADPVTGDGYTVAMFENTIAMAYNKGSEFATLADIAQRINTFKDARLTVNATDTDITATVDNNNVGRFALDVNLPSNKVISYVDNWYAYNDHKVFLGDNGGTYNIHTGSSADLISHIIELPMRARLINVIGNGTDLYFKFEGEGKARVRLNDLPGNFSFKGVSSFNVLTNNTVSLNFNSFGIHEVNITRQNSKKKVK